MLTANKGEWSEFYTMLKLAVDKGFYGVDSDLKPIKDLYYSIIQIQGNDEDILYELSGKNCIQILSKDEVKIINTSEVAEKLKAILLHIKTAKTTTFSVPEAEEMMTELQCENIKSSSRAKGDIKLVFEDPKVKQIVTDYFSIKSFLAGKPTLLNASSHTIFTYEIKGLSNDQQFKINHLVNYRNSIDLTGRIREIKEQGGNFRLYRIPSESMSKNLKKIDTLFPELMGEMLLESYLTGEKSLDVLIKNQNIVEDAERKLGQFLEAVLKGMMPSIEWDLLDIANGLLLVVNGGDVVGFHTYNKKELISYLLKNAYLDTPSTSRHKIGNLYNKEGRILLDLSLQIRLR